MVAELGREIPHGYFGENLTTAGIDIGGARQGERWRLGEADDPDHVRPAGRPTPASRARRSSGACVSRGWVRRFADHGEPGAYLSVVKEGVVRAGAVLEVVQVPEAAKTIREQFAQVMRSRLTHALGLPPTLDIEYLDVKRFDGGGRHEHGRQHGRRRAHRRHR